MKYTFKIDDDPEFPYLTFTISNPQIKFQYRDLGNLEEWQTMKNSIQEGKNYRFDNGDSSYSGFEYSSNKQILKIYNEVSGSGGDSEFELNLPMKEGLDIVNAVLNNSNCIEYWG